MGFLERVILFIFLIIVVAVSWQYVQGFVFEIITEGQRTFTQIQTSNRIVTTAQPDELICDLAITVFVEIDSTRRIAFVDPSMAKEYIWSDCNPTSAIPFASLLDLNFDTMMLQLDLLFGGLADQQLETTIRLQDRETGEIRDRFTDPNLQMLQPSAQGILEFRKAFQEEFFITNIPSRDYDLEIFYVTTFETNPDIRDVLKINEDGVIGAPFVDRICAVGFTSC